MDRPLEQQCWHCGLPLGSRRLAACPTCGTPLRPPGAPAGPFADPFDGSDAELSGSPEIEAREPLLTPSMRTALLAFLIVFVLAGAGVLAGRMWS